MEIFTWNRILGIWTKWIYKQRAKFICQFHFYSHSIHEGSNLQWVGSEYDESFIPKFISSPTFSIISPVNKFKILSGFTTLLRHDNYEQRHTLSSCTLTNYSLYSASNN